MMGPETMMIWMEEVILSHVLNYLHVHNPLNDLAEDAENGNWSVILW